MLRNAKFIIVPTILVCLVAVIIFAANSTNGDVAQHWVTVDASEFQHIASARGAKDAAGLGNLRVERMLGNIAILRLNDQQMEELSRAMHENFHKCSGFVAHTSEDEAIAWVRNFDNVSAEAPAVTYTIDNQLAVNYMLSGTSESYNRQVILDLSAFPNRRYNQPSGLQSAAWIFDRWSSLSAAQPRGEVTVEYFTHPQATSPQPSVIMTVKGTKFPDEIVVLGAHQDSINQSGSTQPAPGADDDASGIACLTETIRVMMEYGFKPDRTVQFMAYAAEEIGLRGSNAIATAYRNENKNVIGVMQLDMTNYKGTLGYDVVIFTDYTNAAQNQFVRDLITEYQPGLNVGTSSCGYACSDHASWHNKNYATSMPFEATINDDNSAIHTANDTIARSNNNANHAMRFTKLALSFVGELAKGCLVAGPRC